MPSVALFHDGSGDLLKLIKCPLVYLDRQYDPVAKLGEEVVWLKNIIESLRLALDLPPMESSRVTEYNQETLECLRRELKILRVGLQERGWPPFVPFPLVHARPRLQYPGLEKEAFIEVPCEGLTPPLISLVQSLDSKRRSREFEAAQVAKMLAIEEYRERRLNAKLKELEEKKQREIENQNYLKEKERKREMRNRFLRKQLEEYYGKKETAK
ncbi:hypothetical protein NCLIV_047120 [Neospora caninum Liverpool]|uniref:Uncharacterized protein n=1 Tax=Neospora caninum (strain Liverpool) TaxID=572307 RepID=F0VM02_NEOCL|nr:hypothetical protein NCLIV_047120 [Neospora caninum Liverpool]CBZ54280.1 hypothetical protein NCLIV_047120 [Neospora caninum Liverpool]|eukprot:XP_003884311.1 hypothetical protein NCLIV_047120 [Neospora caninum Liverpool]